MADDKPNLGLATTAELLEEVAARMHVQFTIGTASPAMVDLGRFCSNALENLESRVLEYRTVDS